MFLLFSVARSASTSQAERANEASTDPQAPALIHCAEFAASDGRPPADPRESILDVSLDVSALALSMNSPFNASYWLRAA